MQRFTKTQQRIIDALADGKPHAKEEILSCLNDHLASIGTVHKHINNIRKVLNPKGEEIVCRVHGYRHSYQHVRLLHNPQSSAPESIAQEKTD